MISVATLSVSVAKTHMHTHDGSCRILLDADTVAEFRLAVDPPELDGVGGRRSD